MSFIPNIDKIRRKTRGETTKKPCSLFHFYKRHTHMRKQWVSYPCIYHTCRNYDLKTTRIAFRKFKLSVVVELLSDDRNHFTVTKHSNKNSGHVRGLERWTQILARNFPATGWQHRNSKIYKTGVQSRFQREGYSSACKPCLCSHWLPSQLIWLTVKVDSGMSFHKVEWVYENWFFREMPLVWLQ